MLDILTAIALLSEYSNVTLAYSEEFDTAYCYNEVYFGEYIFQSTSIPYAESSVVSIVYPDQSYYTFDLHSDNLLQPTSITDVDAMITAMSFITRNECDEKATSISGFLQHY
jgi:hypothetical protein